MLGSATVRETMLYSARLRLSEHISLETKEQMVDNLIRCDLLCVYVCVMCYVCMAVYWC